MSIALRSALGLVVWASCWICLTAPAAQSETQRPFVIASKNFSESYLLGEIVAQTLEAQGYQVKRKFGLGGTLICYEALRSGEIDLYVEYTGTLSQAILAMQGNPGRAQLNQRLVSEGLVLLPEFGFNNTYAIAVREAVADEFNLRSIGDLTAYGEGRMAFSHEFLERDDGWQGMARRYGLDRSVTGIEHGLAYQAIAEGAIDVTDAYSTDGELLRYRLRTLEDNLGYFSAYRAAPLVRAEMQPQLEAALGVLAGSLTEQQMQALNARVTVEGLSFQEAAREFLTQRQVLPTANDGPREDNAWKWALWQHFLRHLQLTFVALVAAIAVGMALSLSVYRRPQMANAVVYSCGLMQTVPSLALLALMIPVFGIGIIPAIVALFLYSLLPIVRNAVTALAGTDPTLVRVSRALGLTPWQQLRCIRLPLAMPAIFAGIRTAAVISIGTATLAAFIGAGGLGEPIVVGLSLNDTDMILRGAIPAALLAILVEFIFEALERRLSPPT